MEELSSKESVSALLDSREFIAKMVRNGIDRPPKTSCSSVRCEPNSDHGFGVDRPTLVLVVRVRQQMNDVMAQVLRAVDEVRITTFLL